MADWTQQVAGKLGSAINRVGSALGNPLPDFNLSESLQSFGGGPAGQGFVMVPRAYASDGFASPIPSGQVLGDQTVADTSSSSGGNSGQYNYYLDQAKKTQQGNAPAPGINYQQGGWYGNSQYWDGKLYPGGYNANQSSQSGGGGGQPDYSQQISEMYAPALSALDEALKATQTSHAQQEVGVGEQATNEAQKIDTQSGQLLGDTATSENKFNQTLQSALAEAFRTYNALKQQGRARFGGGSSAGQAVGELASQEFLRQQGQIGQKGVEGTQQFETEKGKIKQFIVQKKDDLELWKKDAVRAIRQDLSDKLLEIQARRGDIEANKTRDKMTALQGTVDRIRAVQDADRQFQQNLGLTAISKMQELAGRVFTPAEIKAYMSEFTSELPSSVGGSQASVQINPMTRKPYTQDELAQLGLS